MRKTESGWEDIFRGAIAELSPRDSGSLRSDEMIHYISAFEKLYRPRGIYLAFHSALVISLAASQPKQSSTVSGLSLRRKLSIRRKWRGWGDAKPVIFNDTDWDEEAATDFPMLTLNSRSLSYCSPLGPVHPAENDLGRANTSPAALGATVPAEHQESHYLRWAKVVGEQVAKMF